jgi:hypothetical protein
MHNTLAIAISLSAFVWIPAAAHAQGSGAHDPDIKEIAAYRLSIPALNKVLQATKNLAEAAKRDPRFTKQAALKAEIKKLEDKDERTEAEEMRLDKLREEAEQTKKTLDLGNNTNTLAEMAAAIEKEPMAAKALADAGISAREYAKFILAYFQAGMVASMIKQGVIKEVPAQMAATLNPENLKFVQEHEAEFDAFAKAMKALEIQ